mmetsp:Transcript_25455/g.63576  ORF Transcript_25455/g.63576 Transcript_25455/m.63576 type:complete len:278 (-) Transcript_25455:2005-2838(-)
MVFRGLAKVTGSLARAAGAVFDGAGRILQGSNAYIERLPRHTALLAVRGQTPRVASSAFVAPTAAVSGDVEISDSASVWYGAVIRGDSVKVTISARAAIHENVVISAFPSSLAALHSAAATAPISVGVGSTVGAGAILHAGAVVADGAVVGARARILEGARVGAAAVVRPAAVVPAGVVVPPGAVWDNGAVVDAAEVAAEAIAMPEWMRPEQTAKLAALHKEEWAKDWEQIENDKIARKFIGMRTEDYGSHTGTLGRENELTDIQLQRAVDERNGRA